MGLIHIYWKTKNRLLIDAYRLPCLLHLYCKWQQQKKKTITSGASSEHITKLKQSIILRCPWFDHKSWPNVRLNLFARPSCCIFLIFFRSKNWPKNLSQEISFKFKKTKGWARHGMLLKGTRISTLHLRFKGTFTALKIQSTLIEREGSVQLTSSY
jgi:hypothetical protein